MISNGQLKVGAHRSILKEPLGWVQTYPIQWRDPRIDLAELAKLRWIDGWSRQELADHYQKSLFAITNYSQAIRKKDFNLEGLTAEEREKIRWTYKN